MKIRRLFAALFCMVLVYSVTGCQNNTVNTSFRQPAGNEPRVLSAIDVLKTQWKEDYTENSIEDQYLEIIHTKIVHIKDHIDSQQVYGKEGLFKDIDYIVEFELISNYFDTDPYYYNIHTSNCVVVYKDGTAKVSDNLLLRYFGATYSHDFTPIIESIENFGSAYNQVLDLK